MAAEGMPARYTLRSIRQRRQAVSVEAAAEAATVRGADQEEQMVLPAQMQPPAGGSRNAAFSNGRSQPEYPRAPSRPGLLAPVPAMVQPQTELQQVNAYLVTRETLFLCIR